MQLKPPFSPFEGADGVAYLLCVKSVAETDGGCGYAVLDIDLADGPYPYVCKHAARIYEVIAVVPVLSEPEVGAVEVRGRRVEVVCEDLCMGVLAAHRKPEFEDEGLAHLRGELPERLLHMFEIAVYVQMVRVHGCDGCDGRVELEE